MKQYENFTYEIQEKAVTITGVSNTSVSDITVPKMINNCPVRKIGFRAFAGSNSMESCAKMQSIELPYGLTDILDGAFASCSSLEKLVIPPGVKNIGNSAFYNCTNLKEAVIPDTVSFISETAFENCLKLEGLTIAYYEKPVRKPGFFSEIFSSDNTDTKPPRMLAKEFVSIPGNSNGLYGEYVSICGRGFSWDKYDSLFSSHLSSSAKIRTAVFRLTSPVELSENARLLYESFLRINSSQFIDHYIKTDNLDMVMKFGTLGLITNENINNCILNAQMTGSNNVLLYLVSYRYKKLGNKK